jgi:hypothetical protein
MSLADNQNTLCTLFRAFLTVERYVMAINPFQYETIEIYIGRTEMVNTSLFREFNLQLTSIA